MADDQIRGEYAKEESKLDHGALLLVAGYP
jgi:hypothetical protein